MNDHPSKRPSGLTIDHQGDTIVLELHASVSKRDKRRLVALRAAAVNLGIVIHEQLDIFGGSK